MCNRQINMASFIPLPLGRLYFQTIKITRLWHQEPKWSMAVSLSLRDHVTVARVDIAPLSQLLCL